MKQKKRLLINSMETPGNCEHIKNGTQKRTTSVEDSQPVSTPYEDRQVQVAAPSTSSSG